MGVSAYPECKKLAAAKEDSDKFGNFLDWLAEEKKMVLAQDHPVDWTDENGDDIGEALFTRYVPMEKLLAEYFEIDMEQVEKERQMMLKNVRSKNETDRV